MGKFIGRILWFFFKVILYVFIYGTPVLGIWLATSLAAYLNSPYWLPVTAGFVFFPVLPIIWEIHAAKRRKRKKEKKPRILTFGDRITLRTLTLSFTFVTCLLIWYPQTGFLALSARGDWMLNTAWIQQHLPASQIDSVRNTLFKMANSLEWLYVGLHKNPYEDYVEKQYIVKKTTDEEPTPEESYVEEKYGVEETTDDKPTPEAFPDESGRSDPQTSQELPQQEPAFSTDSPWPWKAAALHPTVANMPKSVETSIDSVARYIAQQESDPFLRIKALHDYVADRISYDAESYLAKIYPPQDAQTVFNTHKSVCAGYANLLAALGKAINEEIIVVVGNSRKMSGEMSGEGHAWNAAKIEGKWYLIDATWDSGYLKTSEFIKQYRADYLLPLPKIMIITHFPDDEDWQLLETLLSRGEFLRQPMMRPSFFAEGMQLIDPTRSQTDVQDLATILIENPQQRWLIAKFGEKDTELSTRCKIAQGATTMISCPFSTLGTYQVNVFSSGQQYGSYQFVGTLEFNKRG